MILLHAKYDTAVKIMNAQAEDTFNNLFLGSKESKSTIN